MGLRRWKQLETLMAEANGAQSITRADEWQRLQTVSMQIISWILEKKRKNCESRIKS